MDAIHALVWPYLARAAELWPEPEQDDPPCGPRFPGLIDETN